LCVSVKKTGAREGCEDYTVVLKEILNFITISITIFFLNKMSYKKLGLRIGDENRSVQGMEFRKQV